MIPKNIFTDIFVEGFPMSHTLYHRNILIHMLMLITTKTRFIQKYISLIDFIRSHKMKCLSIEIYSNIDINVINVFKSIIDRTLRIFRFLKLHKLNIIISDNCL